MKARPIIIRTRILLRKNIVIAIAVLVVVVLVGWLMPNKQDDHDVGEPPGGGAA